MYVCFLFCFKSKPIYLFIWRRNIVTARLLESLVGPVIIPVLLFAREVHIDRGATLKISFKTGILKYQLADLCEHWSDQEGISNQMLPFHSPTGSVLRELVPKRPHRRSSILLLNILIIFKR